MPIPALSYSSYDLINGSILNAGGFSNITEFYETLFADTFANAKWTSIFDKAEGSIGEDYSQIKSARGIPVMASYVAFDGEAPKIANEGIAISAGTMPRMKLGFDTNEKALREQLKIANIYQGKPAYDRIYEKFVKNNFDLVNGIHAQINYTAFQIESTGKFTTSLLNNPAGVQPLAFNFSIPAANKKKAGGFGSKGTKNAWSSSSANPIGDLQDMVKWAEDNFIPVGVFRMNNATWTALRDHVNTVKLVAIKVTGGGIDSANLANYPVTDSEIMRYLEGLGLPPIEVVDDLSAVQVYDPEKRQMVKKYLRGFADDTVVLRPAGSIGSYQWSYPTPDFATATDPMFMLDGGMIGLSKFVSPKEKKMEFVAECTGIPVLEAPDYMILLDTAHAAS